MVKRVGILTFEQMNGAPNTGSSRIRGRWLAENWGEAELFVLGRRYDLVIFQRAYWIPYARAFSGIKILDLSDPDFLDWRKRVAEMAACCDAVTVATKPLHDMMQQYTSGPVHIVPDRFDFRTVQGRKKNHIGRGPARIAAWYGYSHNYPALNTLVAELPKAGITELIVVSDQITAYAPPPEVAPDLAISNRTWVLDTVYDQLLEADLVLNPQPRYGRWRYKSNNKTVAAWAVGLPVAHDATELRRWSSESSRVGEAEFRFRYAREEFDVRQSVAQYQELFADLAAARGGWRPSTAVCASAGGDGNGKTRQVQLVRPAAEK